MYHKPEESSQREPTPGQGVNVIKPGSPLPPKPLSKQTIRRIREVSEQPPKERHQEG